MMATTKTRVGEGLYKVVGESGAGYYYTRFKVRGKSYERGLGSIDSISLREAKLKAAKVRVNFQVEAVKKDTVAKLLPTAIKDIYDVRRWKGKARIAAWEHYAEAYIIPKIGSRMVANITREDVLDIIKPLWVDMNPTAINICRVIEMFLNWCIVRGYHKGPNPATWRGNLELFLPPAKKAHQTVHLKSMTIDQARKVIAWCRANPSVISASIMFCLATATRLSEYRLAKKDEIKGDVWVMPPIRRKDGLDEPFRVPLSSLAKEAIAMGCGDGEYVFQSTSTGRAISHVAVLRRIKAILGDSEMTAHGCRSTFRDWAARTGVPDVVAEKALSHKWGNAVTVSYFRNDLLEQRRPVMEAWAKAIGG